MSAPRIGNAQSALNKLRQTELDSRRLAKIILHPTEVAGDLSPARMLVTTLGGQLRRITADDLAKFRASVARLGANARHGLTAAEALSLSREADIQRARTEIRYSMPARLQAGHMHLVTDSGPKSKVTRHHCNVEFVQFAAALAKPGTASEVAKWLVKETALRFECDCEHFRYFLRFVASAGGWVAGRHENGFPKQTNPTLDGACCKHLIRVMTDVQASIGLRQRIAQMIEAERARINRPGKARPQTIRVTQDEAEQMLPKRARRIVIRPEQRMGLPKPASSGDIEAAIRAFTGRADQGGQAIERALRALLAQQR